MKRIVAFVLALLVSAATARAQSFRPPDPLAKPWVGAKMNLGPIYFAPTFELRDIGIDNNVFNDEANPKNDLTGTLGMRSLIGIHFGETFVLSIAQGSSYIYFRRYRSERSIDSTLNATLELRTRVIRPWIRFDTVKTSLRSGVEVDARAERKLPNFDFGVDFSNLYRMGVSAAARRSKLRYKDTEVFDSINLSEALDSQSDSVQGLLRYELTDLSDLLVGVDYVRDRFSKSPLRDNDSYYAYAGIRTKTGAMFTGSATVGYRQQKHNDPSIPSFKGVTANVDVSMIPNELFRVDLTGMRDLGYTYQLEYPYFIQNGGGISVTNRWSESFDIMATARATWLNYDKTMAGLSAPHTDRTLVFSIGPGYYIGGSGGMRLGVQYERAQRSSPISSRNYVTNRITTSYRLSF